MDLPVALLTVATFFALAIERVVENFIAPVVPKERSVLLRYVALALGLLSAFAFNLDLTEPILDLAGLTPLVGWAGRIVTGVILAGGSNLISDWWPKAK